MQPYELSAAEAAALIAAKELSCEELARSTLAHIEAREPTVRAWSYIDPGQVLRNARELDKAPPAGPLHGLTFGVKDIIDTADMPTQYNSPLYVGHRPGKDAACVAVMRHSGALIVGKTDTVEFASSGRKAATRNPHNPAHSPGGSSSGSGAAVGDKQVQLAFGTQTAGSVIRPAAYNGTYAIKPTHGAVSCEGVRSASHTLDTLGWFGRSVEDLQLVARAFRLLGAEAAKPVELRGLKIGLCRSPAWEVADPYGRAALLEAGRRLEAAGATVFELDLPAPFNGLIKAQQLIARAENGPAFLSEYVGPKRHLLMRNYLDVVENVSGITPAQLIAAYDLAAECRRSFDAMFGAQLDAVLTPSSPGEAPEGLACTGDPVFNGLWTLLYAPCVAIPVGASPRALPLGVQLVGPRFSDMQLLEIAQACAPAIYENSILAAQA